MRIVDEFRRVRITLDRDDAHDSIFKQLGCSPSRGAAEWLAVSWTLEGGFGPEGMLVVDMVKFPQIDEKEV